MKLNLLKAPQDSSVMEQIAAIVKQERQSRNMDCTTFAAFLGMYPRQLTKIESGKYDLSIPSLIRLHEKLGLTIVMEGES